MQNAIEPNFSDQQSPVNQFNEKLSTAIPPPIQPIPCLQQTPKSRFIIAGYDGTESSIHALDWSFLNLFNESDTLTIIRVYTQAVSIEEEQSMRHEMKSLVEGYNLRHPGCCQRISTQLHLGDPTAVLVQSVIT